MSQETSYILSMKLNNHFPFTTWEIEKIRNYSKSEEIIEKLVGANKIK